MRSHLLQLVILLTFAAIWLASFCHALWSHPVNEWNHRRIRPGMHEVEVLRLFGEPGEPAESVLIGAPQSGTLKEWRGDDYFIKIAFDSHDRVVKSHGGFPVCRWRHQVPWTRTVRQWIQLQME